MANKRSAASSRGRDLFRAEVSSLLADLGELAGEQGPHPVVAATPPVTAEPAAEVLEPVAAEPAAEALKPVVRGTVADAAPAPGPSPGPAGEAEEPPAPPEQDDAADEELISLSPSYLPPLPPVLSPLTAAPEPAARLGREFSAPPPAPPPGPWAAAPEPEAPPERISPSEPAMVPGLWPFMSNLSTAAGGWNQSTERSAAPDPPTSSPEPAEASEQWVSPPAHESPATGQGWPTPPGDADTAPAPGSGWPLPPGPPPAVEWPSMAGGAPEESAPGPAVPPAYHHHPAPQPPMWPSPAELPPVEGGDDRVGMSTPPAPPPAPETGPPDRGAPEIAGAKLPTGDITAAELAAQDQSAPAWRRAPSPPPSSFPTPAELPGWRLDGPIRRAVSVPGPSDGSGTDGAQRLRAAPPSQPAASGEGDGSTGDPAPPSIPGVSPEAAIATGPPADRWEPAAEGSGERTPAAPPAPIPATAEVSVTPVPATASSGPAAAGRPGLPLLPGGQAALVSTRPWTLAAAMQPLAPKAPPALRAPGASLPEAAGPVLPRSRSSGVNVPFAAVVTALVLVLALILVLIFLALHR